MYRITLTKFILHNGKQELDTTVHTVKNLERYRDSLKNPKYKSINFVYEQVSNDNGEDSED